MKGWTYKKVFINCGNIFVPWVPEVLSRVRRGASFRRQQADTVRPKAEDTSGKDLTETGNRA